VEARAIQDHDCRFGCYDKVNLQNRQRLFREFYEKSAKQQNEYLRGCRLIIKTPENKKRKVNKSF
jgi:hypothetical protein